MHRILLSAGALAALGMFSLQSTSAADMPVKAPPPGAAAFDWSGFYFGGQLGYGWGDDRWDNASGLYSFAWKSDGVFGGLHAGYNRQFGALVVGVQAEMNASGVRGSGVDAAVCASACAYSSKVDWFGSLDGRLGLAAGRTLFYAIGGFAFGEIGHTFALPAIVFGPVAYKSTYSGWNLGAGLEYAFAPNWSVRAEYRYYDFGSASFPTTSGIAAHAHELTMHTARAGVSWLFAAR